MTNIRIGHGYDVHKLTENRPLIIGGVTIPFPFGLLGHSDADVLIHAIIDSLLGASGNPDIGHVFPDKDPRLLNISSLILLKKTNDLLFHQSYKIINIDCTILAQNPKLGPYLEKMKYNISDCLGIELSQINIKATTEEHLGFTGEGLGIAAHAVSLIEK